MLIELPNAFGDAATNMAIDTALLSTLPEGIAVFRHYGWIEPAITFGYTQKHEAVDEAIDDTSLTRCRRITGGGIVDHRNDWTYALIIHSNLPAAHTPANDLYAAIHQAIQTALEKQQIHSRLAPCPRQCGEPPEAPSAHASQCFVTPAANDVLLPSGQKVAGAAMKRTRDGLLVQGSIDQASLPENFNYESFKAGFIESLATAIDLPIGHSEDLRSLFDSARIQKERHRFESNEWLKRR